MAQPAFLPGNEKSLSWTLGLGTRGEKEAAEMSSLPMLEAI